MLQLQHASVSELFELLLRHTTAPEHSKHRKLHSPPLRLGWSRWDVEVLRYQEDGPGSNLCRGEKRGSQLPDVPPVSEIRMWADPVAGRELETFKAANQEV